jgi:alpha-2-macroglobulin
MKEVSMMRRYGLTLLLFLSIALSPLTSPARAAAALQVLAVDPPPGVELVGAEPLYIMFTQAIDKNTLDEQIKISPNLEVTLEWATPHVLAVIPKTAWGQQTAYTLTLGTGLKSTTGDILATPFSFSVQGVGPLKITQLTPAQGSTDIPLDSPIIIAFNRPIITLRADQIKQPLPIRLTKTDGETIPFSGEWISTSAYMMRPLQVWDPGTRYYIQLEGGITATDGAMLEANETWAFSTRTLTVKSIDRVTPSKIYSDTSSTLLDTQFEITFDFPADMNSLPDIIQFMDGYGNHVSGTISALEKKPSTYVFKPDANLQYDTEYTLALIQKAQVFLGEDVVNKIEYHVHTMNRPAFVSYTYDYGCAYLDFTGILSQESLEDNLQTSIPYGNIQIDRHMVKICFPEIINDQTIRITINGKAADPFGTALSKAVNITVEAKGENQLLFLGNNDLMLTSSYAADTTFNMVIRGINQTANFTLYDMPIEGLLGLALGDILNDGSRYRMNQIKGLPPALVGKMPIRQWSETFSSEETTTHPLKLVEGGGKLSPGVYWIIVEGIAGADFISADLPRVQFAVAVNTASITLKRGAQEAFVWVTDLQTGQPLPDVMVTAYHGQTILEGRTDSQGIVRLPIPFSPVAQDNTLFPQDQLLLVAHNDNKTVFGIWGSRFGENGSPRVGYVYTERPVYRPGETVRFRGILRDQEGLVFKPSQGTVPVILTVLDRARGAIVREGEAEQTVLTQEVSLTPYGTFSGEFTLPANAQTGSYHIKVQPLNTREWYLYNEKTEVADTYFGVQQFNEPQIATKMHLNKQDVANGELVDVTVESDYYFGGVVNKGLLKWKATGDYTTFTYQGDEFYSFDSYPHNSYPYNDQPSGFENGVAAINANGQVVFSTPLLNAPINRPVNVMLEGILTDVDGRSAIMRQRVMVHPSSVYVGIRANPSMIGAGDQLPLSLITVGIDSQAKPNQPVQLTIEKALNPYVGQPSEVVSTINLSTGPDGKLDYVVTDLLPGRYRVMASIEEGGRVSTSFIDVWVSNEHKPTPGEFEGLNPLITPNTSELRTLIIPDKESYLPGETANVMISLPKMPGKWTVLLTTERGGVLTYDVRQADGEPFLYQVPIIEAFAPVFAIKVVAVYGGDRPEYSLGESFIQVAPVSKRLNIKLVAQPEQAKPGQKVDIEVQVTDSEGNPVQAEIGLKLVDRAVLDNLKDDSIRQEDAFYNIIETREYRSMGRAMVKKVFVFTDSSMHSQQERVPYIYNGEGMRIGTRVFDQLFDPISFREGLNYTPLWLPALTTDANGIAKTSLILPDHMATWQLDAHAVTMDTQLGKAQLEFVASLPLVIQPVMPRFFVVGDQPHLLAVISNNTDEAQEVTASLEVSGIQLDIPKSITLTVPAHGTARAVWKGIVQDVPDVSIKVQAVAASGAQVTVQAGLRRDENTTIPVHGYSVLDSLVGSGLLTDVDEALDTIVISPHYTRYAGLSGALEVTLAPSLAGIISEILTTLAVDDVSAVSMEQAVSSVLASAAALAYLDDYNVVLPNGDALKQESTKRTVEVLTLLKQRQNEDGGWGRWSGAPSDPYITAYVLFFLRNLHSKTKISRDPIQIADIERALHYLATWLKEILERPSAALNQVSSSTLNQAAFVAFVVKFTDYVMFDSKDREGVLKNNWLEIILKQRERLSVEAKIWLQELFQYDYRYSLLYETIKPAEIRTNTTLHWEEAVPDAITWGSDVRTTAIFLFNHRYPIGADQAHIVRWLLNARRGAAWATTQETAWALFSLISYWQFVSDFRAGYPFSATLNNKDLVRSHKGTPVDIARNLTFSIPVDDLVGQPANFLQVQRGEGAGILTYTARLRLSMPVQNVPAISRGITVQRQYINALGDAQRLNMAKPVVGDVVNVRLSFTATQDIPFFVLEDTLPAGVDVINTSLLIDSPAAGGALKRDDPFWFFGGGIDNAQFSGNKVRLYAQTLPAGSYIYTYQVRATNGGVFNTLPANAYAMYMPDIFGRSTGGTFQVDLGE